MHFWYTALHTYEGSANGNLSWDEFLSWTKLGQLTELISLDVLLNEELVFPNYADPADAKHIALHEGRRTHYYTTPDYVLLHKQPADRFHFLAVVMEPEEECNGIDHEEYDFIGYELLSREYQMSILTNCGASERSFSPEELNCFGLIGRLRSAQEIREQFRQKSTEEATGELDLLAVWWHKTIGRQVIPSPENDFAVSLPFPLRYIHLGTDRDEAVFDAGLSKTFCTLMSGRDLFYDDPELDQIGRLTGVDVQSLYDMNDYWPSSAIAERLELLTEPAEKDRQRSLLLKQNAVLEGNIDRVATVITALIGRLSGPEWPVSVNQMDETIAPAYFSAVTPADMLVDYEDRLLRDLENFRAFLQLAASKGARSVHFRYLHEHWIKRQLLNTVIVRTGPESYSLLLSSFEESEQVFLEEGRSGGGYDWQYLVRSLLASDYPNWLTEVHFDSEADLFCAYGARKTTLLQLGVLIDALIADPAMLRSKIQLIPAER